jgi:hypothetical protein
VVWARLHGYTPALHPAEEVTEDVPSGPTARRTYSEPVAIMDWLVTNHKSDHSSGTESDDEVDVVGIESLQTKGELNDIMMFSKYDSCNGLQYVIGQEQLLECLSLLLPEDYILLKWELVNYSTYLKSKETREHFDDLHSHQNVFTVAKMCMSRHFSHHVVVKELICLL